MTVIAGERRVAAQNLKKKTAIAFIRMTFDWRIVVLFATFALVAIVSLLFTSQTKYPATNNRTVGAIVQRKATGESAAEKSAAKLPNETQPLAKRSAEPKRLVAEKPEQWRTISTGTSLSLVSPRSLALSQGVIELLELTPTETNQVNEELLDFVERVQAAEKKNAYVRVGADGSEEIVVPPFDRGPLIQKFREKVEKELGKNVANFCAEQMLYDSSLALGNAEVRLCIEPKSETNPFDMLVVSRGVHRRNSSGNPKWEGEAAPPLVTKTIAGKDFGIRYRHLFYMANKELLPRKQEAVK